MKKNPGWYNLQKKKKKKRKLHKQFFCLFYNSDSVGKKKQMIQFAKKEIVQTDIREKKKFLKKKP